MATVNLPDNCSPTTSILVAVSGGVDSVVMLHLLHAQSVEVAVAHCNFKLRGAAAEQDEQFVQELSKKLQIPYYSSSFDTQTYAADNGISIQMAARALRYNWFEKLRQEHNFDFIATGHNLNDSLETTILNLARGTGLQGLKGIEFRNGYVIRPILHLSRTQIQEYAIANKLLWREDASNQSTYYKRNLVRHKIIPLLEQLNPGFPETMAVNQQRFSETQLFLNSQVAFWKQKAIKVEAGAIVIDTTKLPAAGLTFMISELLKPYNFSFIQAKTICSHLNNSSGSRFISSTHILTLSRSLMYIHLITADQAKIVETVEITSTAINHIVAGNFQFSIKVTSASTYTIHNNALVAALDFKKLSFPLLIRPWKKGDRFTPLGMNGNKLVSDLLIDRKIPASHKTDILVLESGGEIAWVIGLQISNLFKINKSTEQVYELAATAIGEPHTTENENIT